MESKIIIKKKATLQEVADYLRVSLSAVKQYRKEKRIIMQYGLYAIKELKKG